MTVLIVVFALGLMLVISAVTDISGCYLRRQATSSLADGAALSASDAAAAAAVYREADDQYVVLDQDAARHAVDEYLARVGAFAAYPGLDVDVSVDAHTVSVALAMPYRLPVHVPGTDAAVTIRAAGSAEMPIY